MTITNQDNFGRFRPLITSEGRGPGPYDEVQSRATGQIIRSVPLEERGCVIAGGGGGVMEGVREGVLSRVC